MWKQYKVLKGEPQESRDFFSCQFFYRNRRDIYKLIAKKLKKILQDKGYTEDTINRKELIYLMGQKLCIRKKVAKTILKDMSKMGYIRQKNQHRMLIWW